MAPPDDPVTGIRTWPAFGDRIAQRVGALDTTGRNMEFQMSILYLVDSVAVSKPIRARAARGSRAILQKHFALGNQTESRK